MKNVKVNILLALFAIVGLSLSCTTDSDSGSGSGGNSRQRVVSKIIFEDVEYDYADEYAFKYDSYGRITRVTHTVIEDSYDEICHYEYYRYGSGNGLEISWEEEDYVDDIYNATLNNNGYLSGVYYEDGEYTDEWSYTYDSKDRLTRTYNVYGEYEESWSETTYSWSGGNIVEVIHKYGYEDYNEMTIETQLSYNSKSMDIINLDLNVAIGGWFEGLYIDVCENVYWGDGLCGQKSKNFLTGWVVDNGEDELRCSLKWSYDEDGYPVEVIATDEDGDDEYSARIVYKS